MFEKIVFPMSFPWAHSVVPVVRNFPRDIDEMPALLSLDDAENEICALKHSNFDLHQSQPGFEKPDLFDDEDEEISAVARRSDQPGEIELTTCAPSIASSFNSPSPDAENEQGIFSVLLRDPLVQPVPRAAMSSKSAGMKRIPAQEDARPIALGEMAFQAFEQSQDEKRRKLEAGMARLKTLRVSIKVDSTSSRHALFNKNGEQTSLPLLLPAVLPEGFRASLKNKNSSRAPQGRSQLTWIEKTSARRQQNLGDSGG